MPRSGAFLLLLLLPWGFGQDTRPASQPASMVSDEALRLLAASVMPARIVTRVREICAFGPRAVASPAASGALSWMRDQLVAAGLTDASLAETTRPASASRRAWATASLGRKDGKKRLVVSSRLANDSPSPGAHESAAGASALLESARVLQVSWAKRQIAELPFEVWFELDHADDGDLVSSPVSPLTEIRFGELGLGARRDCLFVTVSCPATTKSDFVQKLRAILAKWKGEKGFWKEFEILEDAAPPRSDGAARVTLSCTAPGGAMAAGSGAESRSSGDSCPVAGTLSDTADATVVLEPHNAVNATRFALLLIAHVADEQRAR